MVPPAVALQVQVLAACVDPDVMNTVAPMRSAQVAASDDLDQELAATT